MLTRCIIIGAASLSVWLIMAALRKAFANHAAFMRGVAKRDRSIRFSDWQRKGVLR